MEGNREDLIVDLAFKLPRVPLKTLQRLDETEARIVAHQLTEHLELCGWRLVKKPPRPAHSTPTK